jgi:integrase
MARPLSGSILTRRLADDTLVYDVKIRADRRLLGAAPEWNTDRAQRLLENTLLPAAKQRQDWAALIPGAARDSAAKPLGPLTVIDACTEYVAALGRYSNPATRNAYASPVTKHLLPFLAYEDAQRSRERAMVSVDELLVGEFVAAKQREREVLGDLPDVLAELDDATLADPALVRAQLDAAEWELLYRYGQRGGRAPLSDPAAHGRVSLSSRGLTNNEVNRCLARLRDIVRMANRRYKLAMDDPTVGCALPHKDANRSWLRPQQLLALLDVARMLDEHPDPRYPDGGRYSAVLMLALGGPRVSEFCAARWRDLSRDGLHIRASKTSAGVRDIKLHTVVRDALEERRARLSPRPGDPIWPTASGTQRDRGNVRTRLLAPVLALAPLLLEARGERELPERVTPHTFRRTYLTYCAWAGKHQRFAMGQAGHRSAKLTLEAYQQALPDDPQGESMVRAWLDA